MPVPEIIKKAEEIIESVERRPFDRFALGPFMIWFSLQSKGMPKIARRILLAGGIWQLAYAWREYRRLMGAVKEPAKVFDILKSEE